METVMTIAILLSLVAGLIWILQRLLGWFTRNWVLRKLPSFILVNAIFIPIPLLLFIDGLIAWVAWLIVSEVYHQLRRAPVATVLTKKRDRVVDLKPEEVREV